MKPDGKAEPRFDVDLQYGRQGELQICDYLTWIATGNGRIEIKRKRQLDLSFYVETHADKGRLGQYLPSGITITTAQAWAFVIGETGISLIIPTDELRAMLDDPSSRNCQERDGSCPTRGKLVSLNVLLYRRKARDVGARKSAANIPDRDGNASTNTNGAKLDAPATTSKMVDASEIRWSR